ncbi:MAG: dienelactone hydrolase family protein [Acidobacteria bacterium]|nr:dienelactone hydrolase family protein [Acidobacteriota bacterium]MCI0723876.1 dienelactone hydrolase family protein [Acidobacteriota bacterium]
MNLRPTISTLSLLFLAGTVQAKDQKDPHAEHAVMHFQAPSSPSTPVDEKLPPGEENAKAALEKSSRHGEYVDIKLEGGQKPIRTWVVYPERKGKAPVVIVIHEIFGLSDWIRGVADQLAEDGFIAVAPDLICGKGPNGGCTDSISSRDDVVKAVRALTPDEVLTRLNAVRDYALKIPAGNKKTATIGYCWGGARSYEYAAKQAGLNAAVVYHGTSPETPALAAIKAPVLGLYGEDDARVNATIEPAAAEMKKLNKIYQVEIYKGAGHGFLRAQSGREANLKATQAAWPRTLAFLKKHTK